MNMDRVRIKVIIFEKKNGWKDRVPRKTSNREMKATCDLPGEWKGKIICKKHR